MKKRMGLFFAVSVLFLSCTTGYAWEWQRLHEAADKKDIAAASAEITHYPGSLPDMYILGLVYLNAHKDREAGEVFAKIAAADPGIIEAQWGLAEVARRQHRIKESEEKLKTIIRINPDFSPAYITLAYIQYIKTEFQAATESAYKVIKQRSDKVDMSNFTRAYLIYGGAKGMVAHYGGPLSKAINGTAVYPSLKKAESLQPDAPGVFFGLGTFYMLAPAIIGGDLDKAKDYLEKAIKADPLLVDAYVRLAQLYKIRGDTQAYRAHLDKALAIDPQSELALDIKNGTCHFICPVQEVKAK